MLSACNTYFEKISINYNELHCSWLQLLSKESIDRTHIKKTTKYGPRSLVPLLKTT